MKVDDKKLKEILVSENFVSQQDLEKAEQFAKARNTTVANYLMTEGLVTKNLLGQAIAKVYEVGYSDLYANRPLRYQILKIPEAIARKYRVVLFSEDEAKKEVVIATDDPTQENLIKDLENVFPGQKITITYSLPEDISQNFIRYHKSLETSFSKIIQEKKRVAPEILEQIFEDAYTFHASDIHFEPQLLRDVVVRFRIDGVLQEAGRIPKEHYENILNRIKVQSRLRIDEHYAAQDGSMHYEKGSKVFDLRTSIIPTVEGEKVVLRMLAAYVQWITLSDLGLTPLHQEMLEDAARKPFGMILSTGPTGSGKTTSLYAVLKMLLRPDVNVTTIEDPVEYKITGANQIQVNAATNLTFAKGLRSIVRQDPDIILVGEIRDEETAEIAVNAALTGHLLLSTFHANDAATAVPRLLDMGIEPFLLASTLELIIAQRLVRKICEKCSYSMVVSPSDIKNKFTNGKNYFQGKNITLYAGKGCTTCGYTGYHGRTALFEFIRVTPELKDLILKNPSTREIWELAQKQGSKSLFEDGIEKIKTGATTLEEVIRIAPPPARKSKL